VYVRPPSGFIIFFEAKPGVSQLKLATSTFNSSLTDANLLPDFQIVTSRALGNGSATVCDVGPAPQPIGGVPAVDPPVFGGSQVASNAINDLSCRFDARSGSSQACTRDSFGTDTFVGDGSTTQFCTAPGVGAELAFSLGDTYLTARVRDIAGQPGPPASIVIRVFAE
jgi:hypothetical protein